MRTYKITVTDNGESLNVVRESDGFNAMEILGILENTKHDIMRQIAGEIKPDIVSRAVIKD